MFNVNEPKDCIGFDSQWKVKTVTLQDATQTAPMTSTDTGVATSTNTDIEIQTEKEESKAPVYDEQRLADFLRRLYPKVSKELDEAAGSQVFKNYRTDGPSTSFKSKDKLLHSLHLMPETGDFDKSVSCMSWNATAKKLAIGVVQEHETWCHHGGMIFIYTFAGNLANNEKTLLRLKTPSCVTALSYHPTMPAILAVGTHTGDLLIINTQNTEHEQVLLKKSGHENVVTQVAWVDDVDSERNYLLATSGLDGCLHLWKFNISSNDLHLNDKYKIKTPMFGRLQRKGEIPSSIAKKVDRGIVAFDFSRHAPEEFVVGAEGGVVALCSRLGARKLPGSNDDVLIADPVCSYFQAHEGEINCIGMSPDRSDVFATNGSDEMRVYERREEQPGSVVATKNAHAFAWVPYSQNLLAACGASGRIEFYDARTGRLVHAAGQENETSDVPYTTLAFHKGRSTVVATGLANGCIQIWDIPWNNY